MFAGLVIDAKKGPASIEEPLGEIFHVSNICLVEGKDNERVQVKVKTEADEAFVVAVLQKGVCENVSVDLFFHVEQNFEFSVVGKNAVVHLTGFYEPGEDEGMDFDSDEEGEQFTAADIEAMKSMGLAPGSDDESDDEEAPALEEARQHPKIQELADDSDSDDDMDLLQQAQAAAAESSDSDNEEEESEEEAPPAKPNKKRPLQKASEPPAKKKAIEKKADAKPEPKKVSKKAPAGEEGQFLNSLKEFVAKKGKVKIGQLGVAVKKPPTVALKLKAFLTQHNDTFKIENDFVSLK